MTEEEKLDVDFAYTVEPYRYAKDSVVVKCPSFHGFKTRAAWTAQEFGRWVHRAGGYVVSKKRLPQMEAEMSRKKEQVRKIRQELNEQDKGN